MEIIELSVNDIEPDLEQPRKIFRKEAQEELEVSIYRWGLLQPIRVRKDKDGVFVIVDGERRWRALVALAKKYPENPRFQKLRAFSDEIDTSNEKQRKAVQLLSNQSEELRPTEKANVIQVLKKDGRKVLTNDVLESEFGRRKNQPRSPTRRAKNAQGGQKGEIGRFHLPLRGVR